MKSGQKMGRCNECLRLKAVEKFDGNRNKCRICRSGQELAALRIRRKTSSGRKKIRKYNSNFKKNNPGYRRLPIALMAMYGFRSINSAGRTQLKLVAYKRLFSLKMNSIIDQDEVKSFINLIKQKQKLKPIVLQIYNIPKLKGGLHVKRYNRT